MTDTLEDAALQTIVRERHAVILDAIGTVLAESVPKSEFAALVALLERTGTPHKVHTTHDNEAYIVTIRDTVLFAFDGHGRCGSVLTEP